MVVAEAVEDNNDKRESNVAMVTTDNDNSNSDSSSEGNDNDGSSGDSDGVKK
jgi:hypothetical protein